jgi:hypothetical protein
MLREQLPLEPGERESVPIWCTQCVVYSTLAKWVRRDIDVITGYYLKIDSRGFPTLHRGLTIENRCSHDLF